MAQEKNAKSPAETLVELERAASLKTMIQSSEQASKDFCAAYAMLLDAHEKLNAIADQQEVSVRAAQDFATKNGLTTSAQVLGPNPICAHHVMRMADVRTPTFRMMEGSNKFYLPIQPWLAQFEGKGSEQVRAQHVQRLLNGGETMPLTGVTPEQVAAEMLHGRDPRKLIKPFIPAVSAEQTKANDPTRKGWYGLTGQYPAPQTDANAPR